MSAPRRALPERPSLEQQRKLARELLTAYEDADADATSRVRALLPDKERIVLADAQFVLAREYGFESWAARTPSDSLSVGDRGTEPAPSTHTGTPVPGPHQGGIMRAGIGLGTVVLIIILLVVLF